MYFESDDARYTAVGEMSSGCPMRPSHGNLVRFGLPFVGLACVFATAISAAPAHAGSSAARCTIFVSPRGHATNTGSSTSPLRLIDGVTRARPGMKICLKKGVYKLSSPLYLSRSGVAGSPIVYRSEGGEAVLRSTASTPDDMIQVTAGTSYVSFRGLTFDGAGVGDDAVHCKQGSNHVVFAGNTVRDTASVGFSGSASVT